MSTDWKSLIDRAWSLHADSPEAVGESLAVLWRTSGPPPDEIVPALVGVTVHVLGEHLGQWQRGIDLLRPHAAAAAPAEGGEGGTDRATGPQRREALSSLARGMAALGLAGGLPGAGTELSAEDRVAACGTASSALLGRHDRAGAIRLFAQAVAEARAVTLADRSPAVRSLAVAGNNLAQVLEDATDRTPAQTATMVEAAEVALSNWQRYGTWLEHERAEYRLARSLLKAGRASDSLAHALHCLALCGAHDAPAFERFFGHAIAAQAAQAAGDTDAFDSQFEQALIAKADVPADEAAWCDTDLAELRAAAGNTHLGRCTCGTVRFRLARAPLFVHGCHCRWCQRETGSALAVNAMIETSAVQLLAGQPEGVQTPSASGRGQRVLRCPQCRVAVWSHYAGAGERVAFVRVGTLADPDRLPPQIHIFTASKQPWFSLPEGVPAVPDYYDREQHWPADSLERRRLLLETPADPAA